MVIYFWMSYSVSQLCGQEKKLLSNSPESSTPSEIILAKEYQDWEKVFHEDFSNTPLGTEPESLFILDGAYSVQTAGNNEKVRFRAAGLSRRRRPRTPPTLAAIEGIRRPRELA